MGGVWRTSQRLVRRVWSLDGEGGSLSIAPGWTPVPTTSTRSPSPCPDIRPGLSPGAIPLPARSAPSVSSFLLPHCPSSEPRVSRWWIPRSVRPSQQPSAPPLAPPGPDGLLPSGGQVPLRQAHHARQVRRTPRPGRRDGDDHANDHDHSDDQLFDRSISTSSQKSFSGEKKHQFEMNAK